MVIKATFISDTHGRHRKLNDNLPGGDIIFHTGDISSTGSSLEIENFVKWFSELPYTHKVFIAGNHDLGFEHDPVESREIVSEYNVVYLQDEFVEIEGLKIYGSPWQPRFFDWAFNIDRNSDLMEETWLKIPEDTDILLTHGPGWGHLDTILGTENHLGCEVLARHVQHRVKPLIHAFGHIHTGRGYKFYKDTHYINSSFLNEKYVPTFDPINIFMNTDFTNKLNFINLVEA